jgi:hypothetical protein
MANARKPKSKIIKHEQWIEIEWIDGKSVTTFYPPNEEFERLRLAKEPQPTLIYRRLNFVGGVPGEYSWTAPPTPESATYGGHCLIRLTVNDWIDVMETERLRGCDRVLQPRAMQPRPEEYGPCPCPRCSQREQRWEAERITR